MKSLLFTILIALCCVSPTLATDVTVAAQTFSGANFNNIGADRSLTVGVTNSSTTVTSAALFRTYIGLGGFTVTITGTRYTVSYVTDASTLVLTSAYLGSTGSATATWHKYVEVRIYSNLAFRPLGQTYMVPAGAPDSGNFHKRFAASIVNITGVNTLFFPAFTIDATTDAPVNNTARYTIGYYIPSGGGRLEYFSCGSNTQLAIPPTTPTNLADLCTFNSSLNIVTDFSAYTKTQIDARLASCSSGQMWYFAATGSAVSCLTVGSGLLISGGTITATGGAGSLPAATYTATNYAALTTDWLIAVDASSASRTVTLYAASGNTGKIVSVCKNDTSVNTVAISDGASLATIYAPTACVQVSSNGSAWKILTY